jgi:hypothetical protein
MEVMGRCGRRRKKFKEEALNHTVCRTVYGRDYGPVIMNVVGGGKLTYCII